MQTVTNLLTWLRTSIVESAAPPLPSGVGGVLTTLLDRSAPIPTFLASAGALKAIHRGLGAPARPSEPPPLSNGKVRHCVERLQAAGPACGRLREVDLAREAGVDPAHLGRLLRQHTGLGFREWRLGIRMRLALWALVVSDEPVKCVALNAGFTSTAPFDRAFHRLFGMRPGEFRRLAADVLPRPRRAMQVQSAIHKNSQRFSRGL
jgi:AraC-like DNA-binding protein